MEVNGTTETATPQVLLPGLPDELSIVHIATKLPWTAFHVLSSVSRAWLEAIRSRQIFAERIKSHSTQTLFAVRRLYSFDFGIYSVESDTFHRMPSIPGPNSLRYCQYVCVEGKIYILGVRRIEYGVESSKNFMYVYDLAGQRGWRQCADMKNDTRTFQCGFTNGRIFVGDSGAYSDKFVRQYEVYDPGEDRWSSISPLTTVGECQKVLGMGEHLVMYGGTSFYSQGMQCMKSPAPLPPGHLGHHSHHYCPADIYDSVATEWKRVANFTCTERDIVVMIDGKLYRLSQAGILVYDIDADTCDLTLLQSFEDSFEFGDSDKSHAITMEEGVAVNGTLFAIVHRQMLPDDLQDLADFDYFNKLCLMRSERLRGDEGEMMTDGKVQGDAQSVDRMVWGKWQKLECCLGKRELLSLLKCPIQL